jgi:hypothetical protein
MRGAIRLGWVVWLAVACGEESEEGTTTGSPCGDLTCEDGTFCLATIPEGGTTGDEEYTCEALPEGCDDLNHLCVDEPACVEDWAADFCPGAVAFGCGTFNGSGEAFCSY